MSDQEYLKRVLETYDNLTSEAEPEVIEAVESPSAGPLHRAAAVRQKFSLEQLIEESGKTEEELLSEIGELLEHSRPASEGVGRESQHWILNSDVRTRVLEKMVEEGVLKQAANESGSHTDPRIELLVAYLEGQAPLLQAQSLEQLHASLQLCKWFADSSLPLPEQSAVEQSLHRAELLKPFRRLTAHFQGRQDKLESLRKYVEALPAEGLIARGVEAVLTSVKGYFDLLDRPPLLIHGIGGVGKTTLVAKFLLDHVEGTSSAELAFCYIDFDRPGFALNEPLSLLTEGVRQLALQYPSHQDRFRDLRRQWLKRLSPEPDSPEQKSTKRTRTLGSSAVEQEVFLDEFAAAWEEAGLVDVPLLVVLDSFEEVPHLDEEGMRGFFGFLQEWSRRVPRLRAVLVGRSRPTEFEIELLEIGDFDQKAAIGYLQTRGIKDSDAAERIFGLVGGNPLNLSLAAEIVVRVARRQGSEVTDASVRKAFEDFRSRGRLFSRIREEVIRRQLFERNLYHIDEPKVRQLAFPGLVLRRIDPDVIRIVLAEPCGLGKLDQSEAEDLFEKLKQESFLIEEESKQEVRYRSDLRRPMLDLIRTQEKIQSQRIHDLAVAYYQSLDGLPNRAEEIYHRLLRGDDPKELGEQPWMQLKPFLERSLGELPYDAQVFLANRFELSVTNEILGQADLQEWEAQVAQRVQHALAGTGEAGLQRLMKKISERSDRTPGSVLRPLEARLYERLGQYEEAVSVAEQALTTPAPADNREVEYDLRLLLARIDERRGDYESAWRRLTPMAEAMDQSSFAARSLESWFLQFRMLHRRELPLLEFQGERRKLFARLQELAGSSDRSKLSQQVEALASEISPAYLRSLQSLPQELEARQRAIAEGFEVSFFLPSPLLEEAFEDLLGLSSISELEQTLMSRLGLPLRDIISGAGGLHPVAFEVLIFAESRGVVEELLGHKPPPSKSYQKISYRGLEWDAKAFLEALAEAVENWDRARTAELCEDLADHLKGRLSEYPLDDAKAVLNVLRTKRRFELLALMAEAFLRSGVQAFQIRRQYAQALIEMGRFNAALAVLRLLIETGDSSSEAKAGEMLEARGLIGRAYKEIYLAADDPRPLENRRTLRKAIESYLEVYQGDPEQLWHGINSATLLSRARRDRLDTSDLPEPRQLAQEIRNRILTLELEGSAAVWDMATAAEACIILEDWEEAGRWLKRYVEDKRTNAFELGSTLRQFEQVLQLHEREPGQGQILDMLRTGLLRRSGGELKITASQIHDRAATHGDSADLEEERRWFETGLERTRAVGKIRKEGKVMGAGFLAPAEILSSGSEKLQLFLTASQLEKVEDFSEVTITFDALPEGLLVSFGGYLLKRPLWSSPATELGVVAYELDQTVENSPDLPINRKFAATVGAGLSSIGFDSEEFSIQRLEVLSSDRNRVRYRSLKELSPGCPLFDEDWNLIGMHLTTPSGGHTGEGILIKAIIQAAREG